MQKSELLNVDNKNKENSVNSIIEPSENPEYEDSNDLEIDDSNEIKFLSYDDDYVLDNTYDYIYNDNSMDDDQNIVLNKVSDSPFQEDQFNSPPDSDITTQRYETFDLNHTINFIDDLIQNETLLENSNKENDYNQTDLILENDSIEIIDLPSFNKTNVNNTDFNQIYEKNNNTEKEISYFGNDTINIPMPVFSQSEVENNNAINFTGTFNSNTFLTEDFDINENTLNNTTFTPLDGNTFENSTSMEFNYDTSSINQKNNDEIINFDINDTNIPIQTLSNFNITNNSIEIVRPIQISSNTSLNDSKVLDPKREIIKEIDNFNGTIIQENNGSIIQDKFDLNFRNFNSTKVEENTDTPILRNKTEILKRDDAQNEKTNLNDLKNVNHESRENTPVTYKIEVESHNSGSQFSDNQGGVGGKLLGSFIDLVAATGKQVIENSPSSVAKKGADVLNQAVSGLTNSPGNGNTPKISNKHSLNQKSSDPILDPNKNREYIEKKIPKNQINRK
ncbi:hypothetical protein GVAV_002399 [Gurleya vavrai]